MSVCSIAQRPLCTLSVQKTQWKSTDQQDESFWDGDLNVRSPRVALTTRAFWNHKAFNVPQSIKAWGIFAKVLCQDLHVHWINLQEWTVHPLEDVEFEPVKSVPGKKIIPFTEACGEVHSGETSLPKSTAFYLNLQELQRFLWRVCFHRCQWFFIVGKLISAGQLWKQGSISNRHLRGEDEVKSEKKVGKTTKGAPRLRCSTCMDVNTSVVRGRSFEDLSGWSLVPYEKEPCPYDGCIELSSCCVRSWPWPSRLVPPLEFVSLLCQLCSDHRA